MPRIAALVAAIAILAVFGCGEDDFTQEDQHAGSIVPVHTDRNYIRDASGRYLFVHGVNVSGSTKLPARREPVSYVGKPFPLDQADENFRRLKEAGFNVLRLLIIWEAIEPYASGEYDEDYLDYIQRIVEKANEWGIYVFLDMHQDVFSRFVRKLYHDDDLALGLEGLAKSGPFDSEGPLNNVVQGDGAPRWALDLILFEKNVYSEEWGLPVSMVSDPRNTSDALPIDPWGINIFLSVDCNRGFATFFAGDKLYPNWFVEGKNIKDYLQDSYANAWLQVVRRVKDYPNVIGYDLMNEPAGMYFVLVLYALFYQDVTVTGQFPGPERAAQLLDEAMVELSIAGFDDEAMDLLRAYYTNAGALPQSPEQLAGGGFPVGAEADSPYRPDFMAAINLNTSFNRDYLQPFHEKVGGAIQAEDPGAIIFIEKSLGVSDGGIGGQWLTPMLRPAGIDQVVYAPHFYQDIYPFIGVDADPRTFTVEEVRFRDPTEKIAAIMEESEFSLGNVPVLLGEFGTYFNFGGIDRSRAENYAVSAEILDNYYESIEALMLSHTQWCYSPDNTYESGEGWNEEDFSLLGPDHLYRAASAWMRPYPRFSSGRPLEMYFRSDHYYYDPVPGVPDPYHEYYLRMDAIETHQPTELFVPRRQYPEGFYVYVSDGECTYDKDTQILYWYPSDESPQTEHTIRLRPELEDFGDRSWDYFFSDGEVRENG